VVALDRLEEDPRNERRTFAGLEGLAASIRQVGILEPLTVTSLPDERFLILTGHRRFRAARMAGLECVEVIVRDGSNERERRRKSVVSNLQREDVPPLEMAEALQSMLDDDPDIRDQQQLAALVGKSPQWVSEMLRILTLPPPLQSKLRTSGRVVSADSLAKVARVQNRTQQTKLVDALLNGATTRQVRAALAAPPPKQLPGQPTAVRHSLKDGITVILESAGPPLDVERQRTALTEVLTALMPSG
jgi:ParB family chromosome partitioning protein